MDTIENHLTDPRKYPRLRENVWHIHPEKPTALLITSQSEYEVPTEEALRFLKMRSYCNGHRSVDEIAKMSGLAVEDVVATLDSLAEIDVLVPAPIPETLPIEAVRDKLVRACSIWAGELRSTYIGNQLAHGGLPRPVLIGWLCEMYHYIKDFPYAIEHGARHATGPLKDVLTRYANEEKNHDVFVLQTLMNLGLRQREIESSIPLLSTRQIGFLMRELFELEPSSALMVAAVLEAQEFDEEAIGHFTRALHEHYDVPVEAFEPYFKHQKIDVGLGHAELLDKYLDLVTVTDVRTLDQIANKIHDLKHAFDLQGIEIRAYYTRLDGKYVPRQPVDFCTI